MNPTPSRPQMPSGYGVPSELKGTLPWEWADERLRNARQYWICTTRPDGRPHAVPVWGVWLDGRVIFGTDRGSRKARNLAARPAIAVHVENGDEAVMVEGTAGEIAGEPRLDQAYNAKYGMALTGAPGDLVIFAVTPRVVLAWRERDFNVSATRWLL